MSIFHTGENDEEKYEIEELVSHRFRNNITEFHVKWVGYDHADNSWETEKTLNSPQLVKNYWDKRKNRKEKLESQNSERDNETRCETPESDSSSDRGSPSPSISSASSASFASANSRQNIPVKNTVIDRTPARPTKSVEGVGIKLKSIEKTMNNSIFFERTSAGSKSTEKDAAILKINAAAKSNTLSEHNETSQISGKIRKKLPSPPSLPIRKRTKKRTNENNADGLSSTSTSRSVTPLDNVTIRSKRSKTPLVEKIQDDIMEIVEEPETNIIKIQKNAVESVQMQETDLNMIQEFVEEDVDSLPDVPQAVEMENVTYNDTLSQMEKGYPISQIMSIGMQNGKLFALLQYRDSNITEWVVYSVVRNLDPQAVIKFFETAYRQEHKI